MGVVLMKNKLVLFLLLAAGMVSGSLPVFAQTIVQELVAVGSASDVIDLDLNSASVKGNMLIAMPGPITPGVKVLSVTDNAPGGGNTYKQVSGAASSAGNRALDIWYCENCRGGVTELKFHLSGMSKGCINAFLEVSQMASSSTVDGGANASDGTATGAGLVGPSITTTTKDFIVARYFLIPPSHTTGVTPSSWKYRTTYAYLLSARPGTHQPTITGGSAGSSFCMSIAAFKTSGSGESSAHNKRQ
jgi:hypothetical protein